jgi:hypothetical protein
VRAFSYLGVDAPKKCAALEKEVLHDEHDTFRPPPPPITQVAHTLASSRNGDLDADRSRWS